MQNKKDDTKIVMEGLGWIFVLMCIGLPAIVILGLEFGIGKTEWGTKLMVNVLGWGACIWFVLAIIVGPYVFTPDDKKKRGSKKE